jgi:inosine-uridine nucleoside N-ribohydrolase
MAIFKSCHFIILALYNSFFINNDRRETMEKVILDTDMVDGFDDGVALLMLENANNIDLLGVTIVAGNLPLERSAASAIRQLEIIKSNTRVYLGSSNPLVEKRYKEEHFKKEEDLVIKINHAGYLKKYKDLNKSDISSVDKDFNEVYENVYKKKYTFQNAFYQEDTDKSSSAVDFMVEQANKYPNEITIVAIGPLTNIAKAILKDSSFPTKVKQIVYMGGAFYCRGNATKNSEFNWWVDPHAAKICISSSWGDQHSKEGLNFNNQIIFGLEVTNNTKSIPQDIYDKILDTTYEEFKSILLKNTGTKAPKNIWDIFAAAYVINKNILLSANNEENISSKDNGVYIDINTKLDSNFAKAFVVEDNKNNELKKAIIANTVDEKLLFNELLYPLLKSK